MQPLNVLVRDVLVADAPEVARLLTSLGYEWPADKIAARISQFLAGGERALVATQASGSSPEHLLGLLSLHVTPVLHRAGPVGRLTTLVVDESVRGQGVGRALVTAAEHIFAASGCVLIEVTSNKRRADAHAFYERLGYVGTSLRFAKTIAPGPR
jgi:ribosomal protein S18 acetylase RimI-like enzyme